MQAAQPLALRTPACLQTGTFQPVTDLNDAYLPREAKARIKIDQQLAAAGLK
jgi:hypothetical protein